MQKSKVYIVGAGPGDPALLTIKAKNVIERADIVLYDRLIHPGILYLVQKKAKFYSVGKMYGKTETKQVQQQIMNLLMEYAEQGLVVVRLKGGDPGIYGRLEEELELLRHRQIPYELIPGITAAQGASLYNDMPLTSRTITRQLMFWSAHDVTGALNIRDIQKIKEGVTLVIYMGTRLLQQIAKQLTEIMDEQTPVLVCGWGTLGRQSKCILSLKKCAEHPCSIANPAMIIIGDIVNIAKTPSWFEQLPEFGKKQLVVFSRPVTFDDILMYTEQGIDVWCHDISDDRDRRFDDILAEYMTHWTFDAIVCEHQVDENEARKFLADVIKDDAHSTYQSERRE